MDQIRAAVTRRRAPTLDALAGLPVPENYRGVVVRADEAEMFAGLATADKDPRKSLHLRARCRRPSSARARRWSP